MRKNLTRRVKRYRGGSNRPTFHILIPSIGRPTLKRMLDSLRNQLEPADAVTVVFDGPDAKLKSGINSEWINGFKAKVTIETQNPPFKNWGHAIQNEWQTKLNPRTTFIMHGDDDDHYLPNAFDALRKSCTDPETLYIARMRQRSIPWARIPRGDSIIRDNIGTPNGIIPFDKAGEAKWGVRHGGDFDYYNALKDRVKSVKFLPDVIYEVIPHPHRRAKPATGGGRSRKRGRT